MGFIHRPLHQERHEIRLIRFVEPNQTGASASPPPIHLDICHVSLIDDNIKYVTLSYAWGDPSQSQTGKVYIGGEPLAIPGTLYAFLTQLRRNDVQLWMWVDSICIKQSDYAEKTSQVSLMGYIYNRAGFLYIWLGPAGEDIDIALEFFSRIGPRALALGCLNRYEAQTLWQQVQDCVVHLLSEPLHPTSNEASVNPRAWQLARLAIDVFREPGMQSHLSEPTSLINGINKVFQKEYWHRIWVIQEAALAKDAVVLCGTNGVSIDVFYAAWNMLAMTRSIPARRRYFQGFGSGLAHGFDQNSVLATRNKYQDGTLITLASVVVPQGRSPGRPVYSATDPRDIVFGVLGIMSKKESLGLRVDYNKTPVQVFTALTRALIRHGEEKLMAGRERLAYQLGDCVPREQGASHCDLDLPSWVPDWREVGKRGLIDTLAVSKITHRFASHGLPTPPNTVQYGDGAEEDDEKLGRFRKYGCRVDIVTEVMEPPNRIYKDERSLPQIADPAAYIANILRFTNLGADPSPGEDHVWRSLRMNIDVKYPRDYKPGDPLVNVGEDIASLIRTMARRDLIEAESLTPEQRCYVQDYAEETNMEEWNQQKPSLEGLVAAGVQAWQESLECGMNRGRTLFKTEKGMLGLGYSVIRPGDVVVLLSMVGAPIILRRRDGKPGGGFRSMGDAYVDGIMCGEFLKTEPTYEDFHIY